MKSALRSVLFALLVSACAAANAQRHVLFSPLPSGMDRAKVLEVARQVLIARGWQPAQTDRDTLEARKDLTAIRIAFRQTELRYDDLTDRPKMRQRNREEGPSLAAIPQPEIDGLRADLAAAYAGKFAPVPRAESVTPGEVLVDRIDPGFSSKSVMEVARRAFVGRRWKVAFESEEVFVARIRTVETDATLRVFLAGGALRYADITNRYGEQRYRDTSRLPERWINNLRADISNTLTAVARREAPRAVAPQPPAAAQPAAGDASERLRNLKSMFESGLITQGEYDSKRAEILKGL